MASTNITINIVEPGTPPSPTPDPVVPNTGLFISGIGGPEATIIVSVVLALAIVSIVLTAYIYRRQKKAGKVTKLVHLVDSTKAVLKSNKHITTAVILLAILASAGTFIALAKNAVNASKNDEQATEDASSSSLTVDVSSEELTIEVADEPVFAILPVDVTVEEATLAGYTLTSYTDSTDLVSTTDSSKVIPMIAVDEGELSTLTDNTYGLSLTKPEDKDSKVYTTLSTDQDNPTLLTEKEESTEENDTTTIYYGFYITPDVPHGTYTGSTISYDAIPNLATVTYNANGLYFNDGEEATTNTVGYRPSTPEAPIEEVTGEYLTPAPLTPVDPSTTIHYTFLGWSETEGATTPTYTNEEDILANLTLTKNESLTLYAVWHYDTVLSFNGTTSDGGTPIPDQTIAAGTTITLPHNTYTRTGSVFTGWNTVETPTPDSPGESYADEAEFIAPEGSQDITLYAQWAYYTTIAFDGNGADSGSMTPQTIVAGTPETLTPNAFTKTNATFIGWNTVQYPTSGNPGTPYTNEQEFEADTTAHQDITLYAQWAYTTISFDGNTSDAGTMNPITIAGGTTSNLPAKAFTKNNCIFTGWNTEASGTGISYGDSTPYTANATTIEAFTLYAQWQCISQVNYYGNGATSGQMASSTILGGSTLTFPQNSYARDGYIFNGWNTQPNGAGTPYPDQGNFTAPMTPATTLDLYAQWLPTTTITFNGNDATSGTMSDQVIVAGTPQNLTPNAFAKDGYIFNGWNTVQTPTTENPGTAYADKAQYAAGITQSESITLYAQWKVPTLYDKVAAMSKGTQTSAQLQATITAPTTTDYTADTSNSGVYEYNSSVFGEASDASNANKIYYYRGVLEPEADQGSYGSDGKATTYPNYVRLGNNTCWRIVRTTGSGGVKMVYNGTWTRSTCANSTTNAQTRSEGTTFANMGTSSKSDWYNNIHYIGYTFNESVTDSTAETSVDTVFGSDANPSLNNTRSNIKTYIEDTWYASRMRAYTNLLEPAAGYCNDRTAYSNGTTTTALSTIVPYITSSADMYFGAHGRNANATNAGKTPSLTCPRSTVDLYRYVPNSEGTSNELKYPAALLTADELSLAGSGRSTASQGSSYNAKSYLRSGSDFWSLSPDRRYSSGRVFGFGLNGGGDLDYYYNLATKYGVRPAISLKPGTTVASGTGIATDPWIINE